MKRGLVIGKFMPVHLGHVALIEFAASRCDELIVSMSFTEADPIPATLRFSWLTILFANHKVIKPAMVKDDFDNDSLPLLQRVTLWSDFIRATFGEIDIIFSSEDYGQPFAESLGARHVSFDLLRQKVPISASEIRRHPLKHWEFIPRPVRPFFVKKICLYGPESTGKSTLAMKLAARYDTEFVPEVAREFITNNDFSFDEIVKIAVAHDERISEKSQLANKLLFCDTDVITTQIYSQHYLGAVPKILYDIEEETTYALYFLLDIDVEWVADGLRDLGHVRETMLSVFREELLRRKVPFIFVRGDYEMREQMMVKEIDKLMN
ncbi:MAG: AAA family ATPase [Chryseolinea sp.]